MHCLIEAIKLYASCCIWLLRHTSWALFCVMMVDFCTCSVLCLLYGMQHCSIKYTQNWIIKERHSKICSFALKYHTSCSVSFKPGDCMKSSAAYMTSSVLVGLLNHESCCPNLINVLSLAKESGHDITRLTLTCPDRWPAAAGPVRTGRISNWTGPEPQSDVRDPSCH